LTYFCTCINHSLKAIFPIFKELATTIREDLSQIKGLQKLDNVYLCLKKIVE